MAKVTQQTLVAIRFLYMYNIVFISAGALAATSLLGSAIGLLVKRITHRATDILLGFCAGMMLVASIVCLIMSAVGTCSLAGQWQVIAGIVCGVALIGVLDRLVPHVHSLSGIEQEPHAPSRSVSRVLLFTMAIAIHKFPEGLATGVAAQGIDSADAIAVTVAMALQNIPEGLIVVVPLLAIGVPPVRVVIMALTVAAIEVVGVLVGACLGSVSVAVLPMMLSLAGGAMLYVISDEMIPETHAHSHQRPATYALIAGALLMLLIDKYF